MELSQAVLPILFSRMGFLTDLEQLAPEGRQSEYSYVAGNPTDLFTYI